jgi:hypothetical protein
MVQNVGIPLWGRERLFKRGGEEGVFLVEGDCENP